MRKFWFIFLLFLGGRLGAYDALKTLTQGLSAPKFWTRIHAAEYLIELRAAPQTVKRFLQELEEKHGSVPMERIGVWRVQAQAARSLGHQAEFDEFVMRIKQAAFADPATPDQVHAVETLFKLQVKCSEPEQKFLKDALANPESSPSLKLYAAALAGRQNPDNLNHFQALWEEYASDKVWRGVLLYILRQYPELPGSMLSSLEALYQDSDAPAEERYAVAAILLKNHRISPDAIPAKPEKTCGEWLKLQLLLEQPSPALAEALRELRDSANVELKILAAYAALKTEQQTRSK